MHQRPSTTHEFYVAQRTLAAFLRASSSCFLVASYTKQPKYYGGRVPSSGRCPRLPFLPHQPFASESRRCVLVRCVGLETRDPDPCLKLLAHTQIHSYIYNPKYPKWGDDHKFPPRKDQNNSPSSSPTNRFTRPNRSSHMAWSSGFTSSTSSDFESSSTHGGRQ